MERTLAIIKPDAVAAGYDVAIVDHIKNSGFEVLIQERMRLSKEQAELFYLEHKDRPFYKELVDFMSSGSSIVMALESEDAILKWRNIMGDTNPAKAAQGTIRNMFGTSIGCNATHGSDSSSSAQREVAFFFENKI